MKPPSSPGVPHRGVQDTHALAGEHGIKTPVSLLSRSRIKQPELGTR
jgi:hypothetical protein